MRLLLKSAVLVMSTAFAGCSRAPSVEIHETPEFEVSHPVARQIIDHAEFTGRVDAINSVQVKARVSGYLDKIYFTDGDEVKAGDKLFRVDPRPYRAQYEQDKAEVASKEAILGQKEDIYQRAEVLLPRKAIAPEDYRTQKGDYQIAVAGLRQAKSKLKVSELNLEWTTVAAPISGRVSQRLVTPGNLIIADQTLLTTIVSLDPIYVYFTVDERTLLRLRAKYADTTGSRDPAFASLEMGLADEKGYSHKGTLNFEDNTVDQSTGTMLMRGVFANPITPAGARLLSPGLFARVRLNIGKPRPGILVADRAIGNDQGKKFVYVIADKADEKTGELKKVVERRYIQIGDLHQGLREIKTATKTGKLPTRQTVGASEEIVVAGLQRLRPGSQVTPKLVDMPVAEEKAKKTGIRKSNPSSH